MKLIYYSLAIPPTDPRRDLLQQLEASLRSLRTYNRSVPVVLFVYGDVTRELTGIVARYGVQIAPCERYEDRLARLFARAAPVLGRYPLLHRFLNFADIAALNPSQVLYLDCDTYFAGDVDRLFDGYRHAHVAAREEPTCVRSPYGYDPGYLDEAALHAIVRREGARFVPPFNLGVVLFNHGVWETLARLDQALISYAWRFAVWMALTPPQGAAAAYGEGQGIQYLRDNFETLAGAADREHALPYPSANRWIVDEMSLWLTLGRVAGLVTCDFSPADVLQNGEFERSSLYGGWILCHYYTNNLTSLDSWLRSRGDAPPPIAAT